MLAHMALSKLTSALPGTAGPDDMMGTKAWPLALQESVRSPTFVSCRSPGDLLMWPSLSCRLQEAGFSVSV